MNDTSKMDKEYLTAQVTAFQNGDESSFSNIYQMISDKLLTHAVFMTKDRMEAEDLLQETMIRIITSIGTLRDPAAFTAWSIQIMRHVYWHKQRRNTEVVARDDSDLSVFENLVDSFRFKHFLDNVPGDVELFAHFSNLVVDENLWSLRNGIAQLAKNFIVVFWRVKQDAGEDHGQNGLAELVP